MIEYRGATEADLEAERAVFVAAAMELRTRRGSIWTPPPYDPAGMWAQIQRHYLRHDAKRCFVAEEEGRIVGFTAAMVRGELWFFAALFIDPVCQGRGIGRALLDLAWDEPQGRRVTITEAIQPVSNGLYAGRGLLPVTPVLGLVGRPTIAGARGIEPAEPNGDALRQIDLAVHGVDRSADHEFWRRSSDSATVWLRGDQPCAYSYRGGFNGNLGPVAGLDAQSAALALRAELAAMANSDTRVDIPGSAHELVRVALDAGLRFADPGLLLLSDPESAPNSYAIHSYWMY